MIAHKTFMMIDLIGYLFPLEKFEVLDKVNLLWMTLLSWNHVS